MLHAKKPPPEFLSLAKLTGIRDSDDVPFIAPHLAINSDAIVSYDSHISGPPSIRTGQIRRIGEVVVSFRRGSFSLLITLSVNSLACSSCLVLSTRRTSCEDYISNLPMKLGEVTGDGRS